MKTGKPLLCNAEDVDSATSLFYGLDTVEAIRAAGVIHALTPEQTVAGARQTPISLVPRIGWDMLEPFATEVLPKIGAG